MYHTNVEKEFNVWPVLIDMITSVLIIFILYSFLDQVLNQRNLDLLLIDKKRSEFVERFSQKFSSETTRDSTIKLNPQFNYLEITFSDHILFRRGEYRIIDRGRRILGQCAEVFKLSIDDLDIIQIQVEGHTDIDPITTRTDKIEDNWDLSAARAIEVVRFFINRSLDSELFSANGFSQYDPIDRNNTESSKARNRRIELKVYFKGLEKS